MKYIPGLNGLRALAVLFVLFYHWGLPPLPGMSVLKNLIPDGKFGVNLFFVLSGFLISSILLLEKEKQDVGHPDKRGIFINFYIRRSLRIFPVYYITLFAIHFFRIPQFNENLPYYLTYTENFNVYFKRSYDFFSHSWSLSVEEQFYLIWPFLILFLKRSQLLKSLFIMILLAPAFSIFQFYLLNTGYGEFILTPSCLDAFGIGGLLACFYTEDNLSPVKKWIKLLLPVSVVLFFYWKFAPAGGHFQYFKRLSDSVISAGCILCCLSKSFTFLRDKLLENKLMKQIGLMSYGIYLFHFPLPYFYNQEKYFLGFTIRDHFTLTDYGFMFAILLLLAFSSYYVIEKPILGLKTRLKYGSRP